MKFCLEYLLFVLVSISILSCKKDLKPDETNLINDQKFNQTVVIDGHKYDGLIIHNCTFNKKGLIIKNADNVVVQNCRFHDLKSNGISIGFGGGCNGVKVLNCSFKNIAGNGINSSENCSNGHIKENVFENIGLSEIGSAHGQSHHAIYWQSNHVLIENNTINKVVNVGGNGISVRSGGIVRKNVISNAEKAGITYFSDNPGFDGDLLIENNIVFNCARGVNLSASGEDDNLVKNILVGFNTLVSQNTAPFSVSAGFNDQTDIYAYGNILINKGGNNYAQIGSFIQSDSNLLSSNDLGFVDFENNNFKLTAASQAIGKAAALDLFPIDDIDGDLRFKFSLDCGADEY